MELNEISKRPRPFSSPFRVDSGRGFRLTGTRRFSDLARHPDNERIGGILAFRVESSLMYFNVENVLAMVRERLRGEGPGVRLVICDLSASPYVDLAGARMLHDLGRELAKDGVGLRITEPSTSIASTRRSDR